MAVKKLFEIWRPKNDPGPEAMHIVGGGRSLRVVRGGDPVRVRLNLENEKDAAFLRDVETRYKVKEIPEDEGDVSAMAAFAGRTGKPKARTRKKLGASKPAAPPAAAAPATTAGADNGDTGTA